MLEHFSECYFDLSGPILCPVLGSITPLFIPNSSIRLIRLIGLCVSLITFLYPPVPRIQFDPSTANSQFVESLRWLPYENIHLYMGIDGLSLFFVILTTFLIPICISVGWSGMRSFGKEYITAFLIREFLMIAVSCMLDPLLFYVLSESVPIPMLKIKAAYQFFLYTLLGSVFMLLAILLILLQTGTTDLQILLTTEFSERRQILLWIAFFASFAVKVPMVPVHIWLPEAHVEAPTAGSVILAGILLKLGTYGFLRFSIPMFPEATLCFTPFIYTLSAIAIIYTSLTTLRQIDLKKIIAYSSVAHMNLVTIGMFSRAAAVRSPILSYGHTSKAKTCVPGGIGGSILLMLSHGLVSSALFLCVGVLYDRHKTRLVRYYGGLVSTMPNFSTIFFFFTLANMSLPGTSSFIGEFLILVGAFQRNSLVATLAALGMILGAAYSLWLYNRVVSGNLKPDFLYKFSDLNGREVSIFLPFLCNMANFIERNQQRKEIFSGNGGRLRVKHLGTTKGKRKPLFISSFAQQLDLVHAGTPFEEKLSLERASCIRSPPVDIDGIRDEPLSEAKESKPRKNYRPC
ncbi:NADH dehydrogenase subunit 4 [Gossypium australe]|uniref:NADH-ubiquinone oxidoreductase chain 4 n=3 Tax=Mesangiospermae TaxID=1437183 RepID=A0A5B6U0C1_9ROSI|nr:NADH dehydrogenase subunit 4 [Gossypium australe]